MVKHLVIRDGFSLDALMPPHRRYESNEACIYVFRETIPLTITSRM